MGGYVARSWISFSRLKGPFDETQDLLLSEPVDSFAESVRQKPTESLNVSCFLFISSLVDKEFIYREHKGSVILRNVETNISTVLIEGKKIVSTLSNDQDNFSFPSCKSIKQKMTLGFNFQ